MIGRAVYSRDRQLGLVVAALSLIPLAAFVGQIYGIVDMTFVMLVFSLPAAIAIVGIGFWAGGGEYPLFFKRLMLGLAFGVAATAAYDLVRLVLQEGIPLNFNAFANHPKFGALITDQPASSTVAIVVGWGYHFSNGLTFALCYALMAGRARWWWGVLYAMVLQSLMVLMYPTAFGVSRGNEAFLLVSFVGHATYGAVLGVLNRRYNVDDDQWDALQGVSR